MKLLLFVFLCLMPLIARGAEPAQYAPDYNLEISFDINASTIHGIARIPVKTGGELRLHRGNLKFTQVRVDKDDMPLPPEQELVAILPPHGGMVEIRYEGAFSETPQGRQPSDVIGKRGIFLTGTWYPRPDHMCRYRLTAVLPAKYEALSEAEEVEKTSRDGSTVFTFTFPHPLDNINFIATDRYRITKDRFAGVEIFAYFFPEDADLMRTYIEETKRYIRLYERLLTEFPYKRFSIVENFLPTGYSMPTYTLLGQQVVRLPFIPQTSLGHEILHQWFGNLVYIDYEKGNWAEGLTSFLADHLYEEDKGQGADYRKGALTNYRSYVTDSNEFPLKDFMVRSSNASEAIGYGKALMVFRMLKTMATEARFYEALRYFVNEMSFKRASWEDLRISFEKYYGKDLGWFFKQWIYDKGLPEFHLQDVAVRPSGNGLAVAFEVSQGKKTFIVDVPVTVHFNGGKTRQVLHLSEERQRFEIVTAGLPHQVVLDDDYDVARALSTAEIPPVISRLMGDQNSVIVVPPTAAEIYEGLIAALKAQGHREVTADLVTHESLKSHSFFVLGASNPLARRLYGDVANKGGFSVTVRENPWNPGKVVGVFDGRSKGEVDAAVQKIFHYGKYSDLAFDKGVNTSKRIGESDRGIITDVSQDLSKDTIAADLSSLKTLSAMMDRAAHKKIIYVGEAHNRFSHHLTELEIIRDLHRRGKKIAIGMEMFQRPYQKILDDYVEGRIDEMAFLKGTEYFKRWRFDYALYRPILLFARAEKIPVVALNQKQEIVENVFRNGLEALSTSEKESVPAGMDFSDDTYRERLKSAFHTHEGFQTDQFDFFYQAQVLWDETMAESIDQYLGARKIDQMVVLAGSGHLSYGSGIPKRTARRNGYDYAIILMDSDPDAGIADYILYPGTVPGGTSPALMVFLKDGADKLEVTGFPHNSASEKAGIRKGDVILSIDGKPVRTVEDAKIELLSRLKGDRVVVRVQRRGFFGGVKEIEYTVAVR